jgi:translation initiation factor 1
MKENTKSALGGKIRIRRDKKGRRGKTVTIISGMPLGNRALLEMAAELKRISGTGGSVKNGEILIQGDRCESMIRILQEKGYDVKKIGG